MGNWKFMCVCMGVYGGERGCHVKSNAWRMRADLFQIIHKLE